MTEALEHLVHPMFNNFMARLGVMLNSFSPNLKVDKLFNIIVLLQKFKNL